MALPQVILTAADRYNINTNVEIDASGSPVLEDEDEQTSCVCQSVGLYMGDVNAGPGKLFITTRHVIWCSEAPQGAAPTILSLTYPQIMMHAISKDTSAFPRPCIYLQLDDGSEDMMGDDGEEGEEEDGLEGMSPEVRLVPDDSSKVEDLFKALCDCAALNPDPDNEGEGDFYFDENEVMAGLDDASRAAIMAQRLEDGMALEADQELDELVGEDPGRFEDEDEEAEEGEEEVLQRGTANGH